MARREPGRYTFNAPGQAGSYFYGYARILDLRVETELALSDKFDRPAFNNFLSHQGMLPGSAGEGGARTVRGGADGKAMSAIRRSLQSCVRCW